jgi:hypothetical protein
LSVEFYGWDFLKRPVSTYWIVLILLHFVYFWPQVNNLHICARILV